MLLYSHDTLTLDEVSEALHPKKKIYHMTYPNGYAFNGEVLSIRRRTRNKSSIDNRSKSSYGYKGYLKS
jgi:hypothetical protein